MDPETRTPAQPPPAAPAAHAPHLFTLRSARVVTAPKICRDFVVGVVRAIGWGDLADSAAVCTSELVTNTYLHAGGAHLLLRVRVAPRRVRVTVIDGSAVRFGEGRAADDAVSGRGLLLVSALADRCGAADRWGVWFELDTPVKAA
ncbi:ATP-binding protein [Streptomyces sp. NPDC006733]|uniref:ATP-binding protein n=1 Tax=Streptomyces sp. NPDC006733 TaxID=3155460 RepID=UPI0033DD5565